MSEFISSNNNTTYGNLSYNINYEYVKDMYISWYTNEFTPSYYSNFYPNMAPLIDENIVAGDKLEENRLNACYWSDLGDDVFDGWGYFYLYDVNTGKYYFPLLDPLNQDDGIIATQTFNAFGRTFIIKHGWAVEGVFKFDITVNDNQPFRFGAYGNMGSDGEEDISNLTHTMSNFTLHYLRQAESGNETEILYSYFIPKKVTQNASQTYIFNNDGDDCSLISNDITNGLLVYFSKTNDVKEWVMNDLDIISSPITQPICFLAGTPINTDQGIIAIEKIDTDIHTIRSKKIVAVTKTVTAQKYIVFIEKHSFAMNMPSKNTSISMNHKVLYKGKMERARDLVGKVDGIVFKKYNGEVLYNILMEEHSKMIVNNMIVETLDPTNIVAKLYNGNYTPEEFNLLSLEISDAVKHDNKDKFAKIYNSMK